MIKEAFQLWNLRLFLQKYSNIDQGKPDPDKYLFYNMEHEHGRYSHGRNRNLGVEKNDIWDSVNNHKFSDNSGR